MHPALRTAAFTVAALCLATTASADVFTKEQLIKVNKEITTRFADNFQIIQKPAF